MIDLGAILKFLLKKKLINKYYSSKNYSQSDYIGAISL